MKLVPLAVVRRLLAVGAIALGPVVQAEVSIDHPSPPSTLIMGYISEDPDPIGVWNQGRPLPVNQVLNPTGNARDDGRPDLGFRIISEDSDPIGFWPVAVWSYDAGTDHDIAFSEWDGTSWTPVEFLTASTEDERDPRVFVEEDGTVHVVWWADVVGGGKVYLATRPPGSAVWGPIVLITDGAETGRRPSVAVHDDQVFVAYERDSAELGMSQDVVVLAQQPGGNFAMDAVFSTTRSERLDIVLHATSGKLWAEWMHEVADFGCSQRGAAGWSGFVTAPWPASSWIGIAEARHKIRAMILAP